MEQEQNNISRNNEITIYNNIKEAQKLSKIALIIFSIILLISITAIIGYNKDNSGMDILIIIITIFLSIIPFIVSLVLSLVASSTIKKIIKNGIDVPKNIRQMKTKNTIISILIILTFVGGIYLKEIRKNIFINEKLTGIYNTDYKILKKCHTANEGGDNYDEVIIELENYEYPIYAKFDWEYDEYTDNFERLKRADSFNYQSYIKSILDDKAISILDLEEEYDDYYDEILKYFDLNILLTNDYLKDEAILKTKIKEIYNKYANQFPDYLITISLYFTENINDTLKQEYYMVMNGRGCHNGYNMKDGSSISRPMSIVFNNLEYHSVDETIDFGVDGWHNEQKRKK